jgi:hypothetical protein
MKVEFLIFALYKNHLLAYKVDASPALDSFYLRLQLNSAHLKESFPDQFTLVKKEGVWQLRNDFEKELSLLIDESVAKKMHLPKARR